MKGPWRLTLDTNPDDCNLRCIMCEEFSPYSNLKQLRMIEGKTPKRRRMDFNLIEKVVKQVANYGDLKEIIPSTMGEPLLYKHFEEIIDLCHKYNVKLNLTTNGSFPKKSVEEWAELLVPITSDIKISWNGATKETQEQVMINSNYEIHLENVKKYIAIRDRIFAERGIYCRVTLQVTFMEINVYEFPDLVKIATELGVDRIKGHHLWAHFPEIKEQSMRRDKTSIHKWNNIVEKMLDMAEKYTKPDGTKILLDNIFKLDEQNLMSLGEDTECPFLGQEIWVAWNGRFNPCCAPDEQRKTLGYFGNVTENSFGEIWEGNHYSDLVTNYKQNELCRSCNMRRMIK